jgi:hypothetical protein
VPGYPHAQGVFLPSHQATGGMIVGYSRNAEDFPLNEYMQIVPVTKDVGAYLVWNSREGARVLSENDREHMWHDGSDMPHGRDELESFNYETYRCIRRTYSFTIGEKAVKQADWAILNAHSKVAAQKAMTARTILALSELSGTTWGANQMAVNGGILPSGQGWDNGTPAAPNIMESLNAATQQIFLQTIGGVKPQDLVLVVGPELARKMAKSQEVHTYLKESPFAKGRLGIGGNNELFRNARFGLPDTLYGYKIVIEDTPRVSSPKGGTEVLRYVLDDDEAYLLSRPGGLVGIESGPNHSTIQGFFYEEFTVELKQDPDNRRQQGRIVTDFDIKVVGPRSGVRFVLPQSANSSN